MIGRRPARRTGGMLALLGLDARAEGAGEREEADEHPKPRGVKYGGAHMPLRARLARRCGTLH